MWLGGFAVNQADLIKDAFTWDITLPPLARKGQPRITTIIGGGAAIFAASKVPDAVWLWIEFNNDPQFLLERVQAEGARAIYANRRVQESDAYRKSPLPPSDKNVVVEGLKTGKFFEEVGWNIRALELEPPPVTFPDIWQCQADPAQVFPPLGKVYNDFLRSHNLGCPS